MSIIESIGVQLREYSAAYPAGDGGVVVNTQVLFPSNGVVSVYVNGGGGSCIVSDRGGAAKTVEAHGIIVPNTARWLNSFAKPAGLLVDKNEIHTPLAPVTALPSLIMLVANSAARAARHAIENYSMTAAKDLAAMIEDRLVFNFGRHQLAKNVELAGESNRIYRYDFQVATEGGRIIVDQVNPFPASINAKAVAHIDLGRKQDRQITQAMVFDPTLEWNSADIIFLRSAAPTVPLDKLEDAIKRRAVH